MSKLGSSEILAAAQRLIRSRGPQEVAEEYARDLAIRCAADSGLSEALDAAALGRPDRKRQASRIRTLLSDLTCLRQRVEGVNSMRNLAELANSSGWYWNPLFGKLLDLWNTDAVAAKDRARVERLNRARAVHLEATRRMAALNQMEAATILELCDRDPGLYDPDYLDWLAAAVRTNIPREPELASQMWRMVEHLEMLGTCLRAVEQNNAQAATPSGTVSLKQPVSPIQSELWFIGYNPWKMQAAVKEVIAGARSAKDAADEMVRDVRQEMVPIRAQHKAAVEVTIRASFYRWLVQAGSTKAVQTGLAGLHSLAMTSGELDLDGPTRATLNLRYSMAALPHWMTAESPQAELESIASAASRGLALDGVSEHPRLERDLLLAKARAERFLADWRPQLLEDSIESFRAALSVRRVKYEREARGRALSDYASALAAQPFTDRPPVSELLSLYQEALTLLPREESSFSRATVLHALGTFHNERVDGWEDLNQEAALSCLNQGIEIVCTAHGQKDYDSPLRAYTTELLGSLYLAQGNAIRARARGASVQAALEAYYEGIRVLEPRDAHVKLRGLLRLAIGFAQLEDSNQGKQSDRALLSFKEAVELLSGIPALEGSARLACAQAVMGSGRLSATDSTGIIDEFRRTQILANRSGEPELAAKLYRLRGEFLRRKSSNARRDRDIGNAAADFALAAALYEKLHDSWRAIYCREREADAWVALWQTLGPSDPRPLARAEAAIREAVASAQRMLGRSLAISWKWTLAETLGRLYANLTWLLASREAPTEEIVAAAGRSKSSDLRVWASGWHPQERDPEARGMDEIRRMARSLEADLVRSVMVSQRGSDLSAAYQTLSDALDWLGDESGQLFDMQEESPAPPPEEFDDPALLLVDATISNWGGVCLVFGKETGGRPKMTLVPISRPVLRETTRALSSAIYSAHASPNAPRSSEPLEALLSTFERQFWLPLLAATNVQLEGRRLYMCPGALAGLPVHASRVGAGRVFEKVRGLAYIPHWQMMPRREVKPSFHSSVLMVADPETNPSEQLHDAVAEVAESAETLTAAGYRPEVIASFGRKRGAEVFLSEGLTPPPLVMDVPATESELLSRASLATFLLVSGHGVSIHGISALVIVGEDGRRRDVTVLDLLAAPKLAHSPVVLLSTCDSAAEESPSSAELTSVASCFLRLGAQAVFATLWPIKSGMARQLVSTLMKEMVRGKAVDEALASALRQAAMNRPDAADWACLCVWVNGVSVPQD